LLDGVNLMAEYSLLL